MRIDELYKNKDYIDLIKLALNGKQGREEFEKESTEQIENVKQNLHNYLHRIIPNDDIRYEALYVIEYYLRVNKDVYYKAGLFAGIKIRHRLRIYKNR